MPLASLKALYFDELADLYDAETQMIRTLPRLAEAARAPELREAPIDILPDVVTTIAGKRRWIHDERSSSRKRF